MINSAKPCGHRIYDVHFRKITKLARTWNISDAAALRKIIDEA